MSQMISMEELASAVHRELSAYGEKANKEVKNAVKKTAKNVKDQINDTAPVRTGKYAGSWRTKTTRESADGLEITVYSPSRYRIAHLLEFGHAKRGGGRVAAIPHLAPAEQAGIKELEGRIREALE